LLRWFHSSIMHRITVPAKLWIELETYIGEDSGDETESILKQIVHDIGSVYRKKAKVGGNELRSYLRSGRPSKAELIDEKPLFDESRVSADDLAPKKKPKRGRGRLKKRLYAKPSMNPDNPGGRKGRRPKRH
jgi:hypothetical protein